MTVKEKLEQEFECAINAVFGDIADKEIEDAEISKFDIEAIAKKVKFYMDLD